MEKPKRRKPIPRLWGAFILSTALSIIVVLANTACSTRRTIIETTHTSNHQQAHDKTASTLRTDSLIIRDSVIIIPKGDTIYHEVTKWRTHYKTFTDTLIIHDTITITTQRTTQTTPPHSLPQSLSSNSLILQIVVFGKILFLSLPLFAGAAIVIYLLRRTRKLL